MSYLLGMLGPINLADFREYLYPESWRDDLPKGLGGSPVNLLSCELLKRGHRLVIFTLDPAVQDEVILEGNNLRICIGPFRPKRARDFFAVEREYLLRAIKRDRPDILHAQWTYEYALSAQASGLPHVITAHDAPLNILRHNFIPYRIARTLMAYWVLFRAKRVISVSPHVENHLRRFMFYRGAKGVIPNGMPGPLFERTDSVQRVGNDVTFATILSGWGGLKNGQVAIEAFALHRRRRPNDRLIMFGAGHGAGEAADIWAQENKMDVGIEFAGEMPYQSLLNRLADEVDVLVHPSLEEAFGMTLIEAMALSIPVIGGRDSGAVPWTLGEGEAGILVDATSPDEFAVAMSSLAEKEDARHRLGRKGRLYAEQRFHIRAVADAYERAYRDLIEAS